MSTLYLLLPQSPHLPHLVNMVGTLLCGGHPVQTERVQPVVYGNQPFPDGSLHRLTDQWKLWLNDLRTFRTDLPELATAEGVTTYQAEVVDDSVPQWCLPHVMAHEAIDHQLPVLVQPDDAVVVLVEDVAQLHWAYAVRAYFGAFTSSVACVWQMPPQALASDGRVSAAYEPQLADLQRLMPVVCTGLHPDAVTHAGFALVESAAALLHASEADKSILMTVAQRGAIQAYEPQHLPFAAAAKAMQRVALWEVVGHPHLAKALQRIHAKGNVDSFVQLSPVLRAMASVRRCQRQWMIDATPYCFADGLQPEQTETVSQRLAKLIQPLDATANDAQRQQALLSALAQALPSGENLFAAHEGKVQPVQFSTQTVPFAQFVFRSPTAWMERAAHAFALNGASADDGEAAHIRQQVVALWHEFFQEEVKGAKPNLVVREKRLLDGVRQFNALKRLLPLTEAGRQMLEADIVYEVSLMQSPRVLLAISSPLTGFCVAPECETFTPDYDLHHYGADFARFVVAYLRMFRKSFLGNAFRLYVEREIGELTSDERTRVEQVRANVMAEYPALAHHVGIEPLR